MKESFKGERILFLSPAFFGYENLILDKLREMGAYVELIILHPGENLHSQIKSKLHSGIFNCLFVIKGEYLSREDLENIQNSKCDRKILYLYDSIKRYPITTEYFPYFNKIYTFEKEDAEKYGLDSRPLFYSNTYVGLDKTDIQYDIASISSFYFERFEIFKKLRIEYPKLKLKLKLYSSVRDIIKNRWKYVIQNPNLFLYKKLSQSDVAMLLASSNCILDIQNNKQNGLTIRTIETLALQRKLITTNKTVAKYDFYNPKNILIINDNKNLSSISSFINIPYEPVDSSIIYKYSLSSFLFEIFE